MKSNFAINGNSIGQGGVYIIAEMSANHGGDFQRAVDIIHAAHATGADAIKLQTYTADTITLDCDNEYFQIKQGTIWDGQVLHDLYRQAYTPWEWHADLKKVADDLGIDFFSSPFDSTAVDFLESLNVPAYKIASFEVNDTGLLEKVAATGKPVIFSTGMATEKEIELALNTLKSAGCEQAALLKCTSAYPAEPQHMNLKAIAELQQRFEVPVGLSDHSMGIEVPVAATALGATVIEKHLTLSRDNKTADSQFSLEPDEFAGMVQAVRTTSLALGKAQIGPSEGDQKNRAFRRSLFVVKDIQRGETFTSENVRSIRPGYGLEPKHLSEILGSKATKAISRGTPLSWELTTNEPTMSSQNRLQYM